MGAAAGRHGAAAAAHQSGLAAAEEADRTVGHCTIKVYSKLFNKAIRRIMEFILNELPLKLLL